MEKILRAVARSLFTLTAISLWGALAWGCLRSGNIEVGQGTLLLIAGTIAALMAGLDDIQMFKASATGVEARMRATVERAENAVTEVQELAKITSMFMIDFMQAKRFLGSAPATELEAKKNEILTTLRNIGLSEKDISSVALADKRWVKLTYENAITSKVPTNPEQNARWSAFSGQFRGLDDRPPVDDILKEIEAVGDSDPRRTALAEDLKYYLRTGTHRRPNIWSTHDTWHIELPPSDPA